MPPNNSKFIDLNIDRADIGYFRWTVESYDGIAGVSTLDPKAATIRINLAPGCENTLIDLLNYMRYHETISIDLESAELQVSRPN